eukprot:EG_transcript_12145
MKIIDIPDEDGLHSDFDPSYVEERDGLRWVRPYWKLKRFRVSNPGPRRTLEQVLQHKFGTQRSMGRQVERERFSVQEGTEWRAVNDPQMLVWDGMMVQYGAHVHEPPVSAERITIIYEDRRYIVINKPASMPSQVNPPYYQNSVLNVLYSQYPQLKFLSLIHRLDLVTSGILMLAKDDEALNAIRKKMQVDPDSEACAVRKHYVARVKGEFPEGEVEVTRRLWAARDRKRSEPRVRFLEEGEEAPPFADWVKTARTVFCKRTYHPRTGTSTVDAWIATGRTHQIRVHLLSLGHPIVNDPDYGVSGTRRARRLTTQDGDMATCEECGTRYITEAQVVPSHMVYLHSLDYTTVAASGDVLPPCDCSTGCGRWDEATGQYHFHTAPPRWLDDEAYAAGFYGREYYEPNFPGSRYGPDDVCPQRSLLPSAGPSSPGTPPSTTTTPAGASPAVAA